MDLPPELRVMVYKAHLEAMCLARLTFPDDRPDYLNDRYVMDAEGVETEDWQRLFEWHIRGICQNYFNHCIFDFIQANRIVWGELLHGLFGQLRLQLEIREDVMFSAADLNTPGFLRLPARMPIKRIKHMRLVICHHKVSTAVENVMKMFDWGEHMAALTIWIKMDAAIDHGVACPY